MGHFVAVMARRNARNRKSRPEMRIQGLMSFAPVLAVLVLPALLLVACNEPPPPTINLYRAIHSGDLDQIKRHIYWGTDLNQTDPQGENPLLVAARHGRLIIARELLKNGADPNARNRAGETPLQVALSEGKTQLAGVLFDEGAADDPQELLFALARAGVDDRDSLGLLIQRGAQVNAKDEAGLTPLHIAVVDGRHLLLKRLIDLGADVNIPDDGGRTPLAIAIGMGDRHIIELLERSGARAEPKDPAH
jgi:ankyrin repeat protein